MSKFEETPSSSDIGDQPEKKKVSGHREREARFNIKNKISADAGELQWQDEDRLVFPPGVSKRQFLEKKVWDMQVEPIFEYQALREEIEKEVESNTKKKEALRELEEARRNSEGYFSELPGWADQKTDEEKIAYLKRVAKTLGFN